MPAASVPQWKLPRRRPGRCKANLDGQHWAPMQKDFDVIVVGAGGSGLAAAVSAAEQGAQVLVLEKQTQPGGTTGIAVGSYTAAGTTWQAEAGIDDCVADHIEDVAKFAPPEIEDRNHQRLRQHLLHHAAETLAWLAGKGLQFVGPRPEPPNRVPRMHNVAPGAKAYIAALQIALESLGGQLLCDARVDELIRDESGRVGGVEVLRRGRAEQFTARRAVILAAGDYSNNPTLIAEHKGGGFRDVEGINPAATGDGHRLALAIGAQLVNMDVTYGPEFRFISGTDDPFRQYLPAGEDVWSWVTGAIARRLPQWAMNYVIRQILVTWLHPEPALFRDGAILVNQRGERFVNEKATPDREIAAAEQPGKEAFLLLDGRLVKRYSAWPNFISTAPDTAYAYVSDYQRLRSDITVTGLSLTELVARMPTEMPALEATVAEYNRYVRGETGDRFRRTADRHPLEGGPWVLLGPLKAYFTTTEGGVAVNERMQALDEENRPIPGLFAVGQNGSGGQILWGHGLHLAWAFTSGRLAGKAAAGSEG